MDLINSIHPLIYKWACRKNCNMSFPTSSKSTGLSRVSCLWVRNWGSEGRQTKIRTVGAISFSAECAVRRHHRDCQAETQGNEKIGIPQQTIIQDSDEKQLPDWASPCLHPQWECNITGNQSLPQLSHINVSRMGTKGKHPGHRQTDPCLHCSIQLKIQRYNWRACITRVLLGRAPFLLHRLPSLPRQIIEGQYYL